VTIVRIERETYETIEVGCPSCGITSIYNRISDLGTTRPPGGRELDCLQDGCGHTNWVTSWSSAAPHEMLIHDAANMLAAKRHAMAVILTTVSLEFMLSLYLRVRFVYRPWARSALQTPKELNEAHTALESIVGKWTFSRLRGQVLHCELTQSPPRDLDAALLLIRAMRNPQTPPESPISKGSIGKRRELLELLNRCSINEVRNAIVHHHAARASRERASAVVEEATSLISLANAVFGLRGGDSPEWYRSGDLRHPASKP
jgi:hypothetical protein